MKTYKVVNFNNGLVIEADTLDKAIKRAKQESFKIDTQIHLCDNHRTEAVVVTYSKGKEV